MLDPNKAAYNAHLLQTQQQQQQSAMLPPYSANGDASHSAPPHSSHHSNLPPSLVPKVVQQSTISRFACRILVDRKPPYCARIYAAGFDSSKNIFLGEKATKWQTNGEIDGLTTNGILIMHPKKQFVGKLVPETTTKDSSTDEEDATALIADLNLSTGSGGGVWREVSVCGEIYSVRETRSASQKGVKIESETNVLQDGTLIDLCGATLMWRSADGLSM